VTLVLASNAPDADVLAGFRGEYFSLAFRRGVTHGVPAMVLLPFLVAGGVLAWDRWVRRRRDSLAPAAVPREVLLLSFLGVLVHTPLDWLNVYGARWWLPFDGSWSYGDALFIADPWLWLLLGSAAFLARAGGTALWAALALATTALMLLGPVPDAARILWLTGLAAAVALRRWGGLGDDARRRRVTRAAAATAAAYVGLMVLAAGAGERRVLAAAAAAGLETLDAMVSPSAANPFAAEVEVVTSRGYVPGELRWLPRPQVTLRPDDVVPFLRQPAGMPAETLASVLAAARAKPDVRHYLIWSRYPHVEVRRSGEEWEVRWSDARYDDGPGAGGLSGVGVRVPASP
jgi:inner membrane protein